MLTRKQLLKTGATLAIVTTLGGLGAGVANAAPSTPDASVGAQAQHDSAPEIQQRFTDVPDNLMFSKEINWIHDAGITTGWPDGTYRPHAATQRAAAVAFLYRLNGSPDVQLPAQSPFKDVTPDNPFYKEIVWAHNVGIANGWADGTFRPCEPITREALAAFMYRNAGSPAVDQSYANKFKDVAGSQFKDAIAWMAQEGISTGWADGTFRPYQSANRDATAAFMYRFAMNQHVGA